MSDEAVRDNSDGFADSSGIISGEDNVAGADSSEVKDVIGLSFSTILKWQGIEEKDIRTYNPVTLAFIGDTIYDLIVRSIIVGDGNAPVNTMNKRAAAVVRAESQARVHDAIIPVLTEEEADIMRRGKNAHKKTSAKNASISDYHKSTGLEALIGYLYLMGREERILALLKDHISDI